jgi:hypothetical protein
MARGVPGVVTCGDRREYPREAWGWKDWEDEERLQAQLGKEMGNTPVIPPPGPQSAVTSLYVKPRGRERRGVQSRAVDKLIEKHLGP